MTVAEGLLRRALRNMGLLLSSKGMAGLLQLSSFAIMARGLGPIEFGYFVLLQTHATLLSGLMTVQSNQAVIHFGVKHLESGEISKFQALIKAGTLVDVAGAVLAMILAILLAPLLADFMEWDARIVQYAQLYAPVTLASAIATPKGLLRLFGNFGALAQQNLVTPALRLLGSGLAFAFDAPLPFYLAAWLLAAYAGGAFAIWQAWTRAGDKGLLKGMTPSITGVGEGSPGLWRFMMVTNLYSTLALVPKDLATYLVGALAGPVAAGLFKVARELATALGKPVDLLNQTLYPDLARLALASQWPDLLRSLLRATLLGALVAGTFLGLIFLIGEPLIGFAFGRQYLPAADVLNLLASAAIFTMMAFAAEPALYALGRPGDLLKASVIGNSLLFVLMIALVPRLGLDGAGWAAVGAALVSSLLLAAFTTLALKKAAHSGDLPQSRRRNGVGEQPRW